MAGGLFVSTASATGAAHTVQGTGSEDAVTWTWLVEGRAGAVAAVADGHSDPRCVRAARGAALAVQAAVEVCGGRDLSHETLATSLVGRWRDLVDHDAELDPVPGADASSPADRWSVYGTTLIVCRVDPSGTLLVQVGDGDAVVADHDSAAYRPLPPDGLEASSTTHSLSAIDSVTSVRWRALEPTDVPRLIVLSTDGLDNAYPTRDALLTAAEELLVVAVDEGTHSVEAQLGPWVRSAAATSGDDSTVAVIAIGVDGRTDGE